MFNFDTLIASDFFGIIIIMMFIDFLFMSLLYGFSKIRSKFRSRR